MGYLPPATWLTRMTGLQLNGMHQTEGWGLFKVDNHLEVQRIDDENKLSDDDEALALAKKQGLKFENPHNKYELTQ